jgi:tetratricopeptide (TPR) repeat protein
LLTPEECREFLDGGKVFRFDLYRIPFNGGKGGEAVPIEGASGNGRSNFFAKYSPDGRWIVFCRANSFMLLQPDSELYIIPAEGGAPRRLECNLGLMNSWHSFSPNGKWLVFSSKANTPYTQLFLAHMDEKGRFAPPVALAHLSHPDRAANIPEFVNLRPGAITTIKEAFVNDESYMRTALENVKTGDYEAAAELYRKALAINPDNAEARAFLGGLLSDQGHFKEAYEHLGRVLELNPEDGVAHYNLGNAFAGERRYDDAMASWQKAIALAPDNLKAYTNLSAVLLALGRGAEAEAILRSAVAANPETADAHCNLGQFLFNLGRKEESALVWQECLRRRRQNLGETGGNGTPRLL